MTTFNLILFDAIPDLVSKINNRITDVTAIIYRVGNHSRIVTMPSGEIKDTTLPVKSVKQETSLSIFQNKDGITRYTCYTVPTQTLKASSIKFHRNFNTLFQPIHPGYGILGPIVKDWLDGVYQATIGNREEILARTAFLKEDLMAAAWHPRRVQQWLEQGVEFENF